MIQSYRKINIFFKISIISILFGGINTLYTIGLKNPNIISSSAIDNINWGIIPFLLAVPFFILSNKIKNYKRELIFALYTMFFILFYNFVLDKKASVVFIINSFLGPCFLALVLRNYIHNPRTIYKMIMAFFFVEILICSSERLLMQNFFVQSQESLSMEDITKTEFRSLSIHGHPLQGALMLTVIMSFIYACNMQYIKKLIFLTCGFAAIMAFNTRSSMVYWAVLIGLLVVYNTFSKATPTKYKIIGFFYILLGISALSYLISKGWGGRLIEMSLFDESSASVRVDLFYMFNFLSLNDILWGIPLETIEYIKYMSGIAIIENYWVIYVFSYGLVGTIIFVVFTAACLRPLLKNYTFMQKVIVVGSFLLISSTNNSMATNCPAMFIFVLCAYAFQLYCKKTYVSMDMDKQITTKS